MDYKKPLKFELICEDLRSQVLLEKMAKDGRLPSEEELSEKYSCSRPTIRKALEKLQIDGVIHKIKGSGSYVNQLIFPEIKQEKSHKLDGDSFFGLIFPNLGTGYIFDSISSYVATYLAAKGFSLIWGGYLSPLSSTFMKDITNICNRYIQLGVKGVFFSPFEYYQNKEQVNHFVLSTFSNAGIPVVLLDSDVEDFPDRTPFDLISLDHIANCYSLSDHILSQGVNKLLFFAPPSSMETIRLRLVGYHEALLVHGIVPKKEWYVIIDPEDTEAVDAVIKKLDPEGIICSNDGTAMKLMRTFSKLGIKVPEQILMASFDNLSYLSDIKIPLTSVMQPVQEMSMIAVQAMLQRIDEPNTPIKTIRLSGKIIVRKSSIKPNTQQLL